MNDKNMRKYEVHLKEAVGLKAKTIISKLNSLAIIKTIFKGDIRKLTPKKLIFIKDQLRDRDFNGKKLTLKRIRRILTDFKKYLKFWSQELGFKSKITPNLISYLSLTNEEMAETYITTQREFPLLEQVILLCRSITIESLIDMRDQALIAFLILFGVRNETLRTVTLGCIDRMTLELILSPSKGVKTKNSKLIRVFCFKFNDYLVQIIREWISVLSKLGYSQSDPLFPNSLCSVKKCGGFTKREQLSKEFMRSPETLNNILKERVEQAGMRYFSAHCYRHSCAHHALRCVENALQLKAVSQQFGHKTMALLLTTYGNLSPFQQRDVIGKMDFSEKNSFGF